MFGKQLFLRPASRPEPIAKRMKAEQLDEEMPPKFIGPEPPEAEEEEEAPPPPPPPSQPPDNKKKPPIQQAEDSQLDLGVQLKQESKEEPELEGPEVKEELMQVKKEMMEVKKELEEENEPGCQLKEEPQLERSHKSANKQFAPSTKQLENEIREREKVLEKMEAEEKKSSETPSAAQPELSQEEKPEEQAQSSASTEMSEEEKKQAASDMNRLKSLELLKAAEKKEAKKPEKGEELQQKMRAENDAAQLAARTRQEERQAEEERTRQEQASREDPVMNLG